MKGIQRRSEAREGRQSDAGRSRREMRGDGWGSLGMRALYDFICWEPGTKRLKQKPHHWDKPGSFHVRTARSLG